MEILLNDKLKDYLKDKKSKQIIINSISTKVCCGGVSLPVAKIGQPDSNRGYYHFHLADNVEVYVQKGIEAKNNKLFLNLKNFLIFKDI